MLRLAKRTSTFCHQYNFKVGMLSWLIFRKCLWQFAAFSDNFIRIGKFPDYRGPYKSTFGLHPWDYHLTNHRWLQGSLYLIPLSDYRNFLRVRRFIGFDFPEDLSHSVPKVFLGVTISQEDFHFLSPIQFQSWDAKLVDFPKVLVSFRVLTRILPLHDLPIGCHVSTDTPGRRT